MSIPTRWDIKRNCWAELKIFDCLCLKFKQYLSFPPYIISWGFFQFSEQNSADTPMEVKTKASTPVLIDLGLFFSFERRFWRLTNYRGLQHYVKCKYNVCVCVWGEQPSSKEKIPLFLWKHSKVHLKRQSVLYLPPSMRALWRKTSDSPQLTFMICNLGQP